MVGAEFLKLNIKEKAKHLKELNEKLLNSYDFYTKTYEFDLIIKYSNFSKILNDEIIFKF